MRGQINLCGHPRKNTPKVIVDKSIRFTTRFPTCQWIYGDKFEDFQFCGCETEMGLQYCPGHMEVAYVKVSA